MLAPFPWLWVLGAGVALVVGIIAFLVASGIVDNRPASPAEEERARAARGSSNVRRAS